MDFHWVTEHAWLIGLTVILFLSLFIGTLALVGNHLWVSSLNSKMGQVDNIRVSMEQWTLNTSKKVDTLVEDVNGLLSDQNRRIASLDNKVYEISAQQAASDSKIAQLNANMNGTNVQNRIELIQGQLDRLEQMIMQLNQSFNYTNSTNLTESPPPDIPQELQSWGSYDCYWRLREHFGRYLNPEWLCSASQQMPEYSGWNAQACSCAREAGINV